MFNKNFLYVLLVAVFSIGLCAFTIGFFYDWYQQYQTLEEKVLFLEKEITRINNECTHMREMDTLILNMSEYNSKDIKVMEENFIVLSTRVRKTEEDLDYLYVYD